MLIEIEPDVFVQTAQIETVEITHSARALSKARVTFASGRSRVFDIVHDRIGIASGSIVPAPAGYVVITSHDPHEHEPEPFHTTMPVVAFRVDGSSGGPLTPITDEGEIPESWTWALIRPDGTVTSWDRSFDTVDEYKAHFASTARRIAA